MFVDTLLVFDHVTHRIKVCSHVRLDGNIEKAYEEATHRIDALVERLRRPVHEQARITGLFKRQAVFELHPGGL